MANSEDYYMDLDLHQNALKRAIIGEQGTDAPKPGQIAFSNGKLYVCITDSWVPLTTEATTEDGKTYYVLTDQINAENGVAPLDASKKVPIANLQTENLAESVAILGATLVEDEMVIVGTDGKLISKSMANIYIYGGSVDNFTDLPSGKPVGTVYNVVNAYTSGNRQYPAGTNFAYNGTEWEALGGSIDTRDLQIVGNMLTTKEAVAGSNATDKYAAVGAIKGYIADQDYATNTALTNGLAGKLDNSKISGTAITDNSSETAPTGAAVVTYVTNVKTGIETSVADMQVKGNLSASVATDTGSATKYPSVAAVENYVTGKITDANLSQYQTVANIEETLSASADKYPSSKAVKDVTDTLATKTELSDAQVAIKATTDALATEDARIAALIETADTGLAARMTAVENVNTTQTTNIGQNTADIATLKADKADSAKLAQGATGATKVTYNAQGIITSSEAMTVKDLDAGTEGQVLTTTASGVAWQTPTVHYSAVDFAPGEDVVVASGLSIAPSMVQITTKGGEIVYADVVITSTGATISAKGTGIPDTLVARFIAF